MVSSIQNDASDSLKQLMAQMFQNIGAADTDGTQGLSKSELATVDAGNDIGGSAFLKSLQDQFDTLDADANGQLSTEEISLATPSEEPMGPPPGLEIDSEETDEVDVKLSVEATAEAEKTTSNNDIFKRIVEKLLDNFIDSYNKQDSTEDTAKATSLLNAADVDGVKGISADELASIDTSKNPESAEFINDLINNFKTYDADGDGQLSKTELLAAVPKEFSKQEMAAMAEDEAGKLGNFLGSASSNFVEKLINSYKNIDFSGLAKLASTVSEAI